MHGGPRLVAPPDRVQAGREELVLARQAVLLYLQHLDALRGGGGRGGASGWRPASSAAGGRARRTSASAFSRVSRSDASLRPEPSVKLGKQKRKAQAAAAHFSRSRSCFVSDRTWAHKRHVRPEPRVQRARARFAPAPPRSAAPPPLPCAAAAGASRQRSPATRSFAAAWRAGNKKRRTAVSAKASPDGAQQGGIAYHRFFQLGFNRLPGELLGHHGVRAPHPRDELLVAGRAVEDVAHVLVKAYREDVQRPIQCRHRFVAQPELFKRLAVELQPR